MKYRFLALSTSLMLFAFPPMVRAQDASAPHLAKRGDATQLIVDASRI